MKQFTLLVLSLTFSVLSFGQSTDQTSFKAKSFSDVKPTAEGNVIKSKSIQKPSKALGAVLFSETFGSGLAGDGSNGAWTTNGNSKGVPNPLCAWEYRGTSTTPDIAVGSRGAYVGTRGPIVSPTASNGFFIFDSDYLDNAGSSSTHGAGDAPTPHESWLISPVFSTVGFYDVVINMNVFFRRYQGDGYILLSNDGGTTWGDSIMVFDPDFGVNLETADDHTIFEKATYISDSPNARIAFFFDGITTFNSFGSGYYYWMIDDISVEDNADNNLVMEEVYLQTTNDSGIQQYYTHIPVSQSMYDSVQLSGWVRNAGKTAQPDTRIEAHIGGPNGPSTLVSNTTYLNVGGQDSLIVSDWVSFADGIGLYSWELEAKSDSVDDVPQDNFKDSVFVNINDSTYGRDYNAFGNYWFGSGTTFEIGPMFEIYDSVKATSISVNHSNSSADGEIISVYLYDNNFNQLSKSEFLTIDSTQNGSFVSYKIPEVILPPGQYVATFRTYSDEVFFRISPTDADPQTVFVQVDGDGTWGWVSRLTAVRLNVSEDLFLCDVQTQAFQTGNNAASANVTGGEQPYTYLWSNGQTTSSATGLASEATHNVVVTDVNGCVSDTAYVYIVTDVNTISGLDGVSVFPNPSNGQFNVQFENGVENNGSISVSNLAGSQVYFKALEPGFSGTLPVDLSNLKPGVYFVNVDDGKGDLGLYKLVIQ